VRLYFDYAATTPTRHEVIEAMVPYMYEFSGNPSSRHSFGSLSKKSMLDAHVKVAGNVGAAGDEIIFTGSGTEAINTVLKGVVDAAGKEDCHIITSAIEHHAVIETCKYLSKKGCRITYLPVDSTGMVDPDDVKKAITNKTVLISIMHVNNEIGTIQPIAEIGRIANTYGIPFHSDSVQAVGHLNVDVNILGINFLSMSAHKFYGPKGVGALVIRKDSAIMPLLHGGGQERGLRSGTPNVPGVAGFSKALELAILEMDDEIKKNWSLRRKLIEGLQEFVSGVRINGHPTETVPHIINVYFKGTSNEDLMQALDQEGIFVSKGAACGSAYSEPSHVLTAVGLSQEEAHSSIRLSLGRWNTEADIDLLLDVISRVKK
jgi:cysteine desulfurase